jgi:hypothetical protein
MIIMDKSRISSEIEGRVRRLKTDDYSTWTIGITDTPKIKKDQHDNEGKEVKHWKDWSTNNEKEGRGIEEYFLDKGMKGDSGSSGSASYVYIF